MKKFDIVSDIHGCFYELIILLGKLGYEKGEDGLFRHSERVLVSVGDIVDRGPSSFLTFDFVRNMVRSDLMLVCRGNHDDKLMRWAKGNEVSLTHGLDKTAADFVLNGASRQDVVKFIKDLPYYLTLDGGKLIVVHASWKESLLGREPTSRKCRSRCLWGPTTGRTLPGGYPDRTDWVVNRELKNDSPYVVYGHQVYKKVRAKNKTYGIDTGCVFGGSLTALRYPEMKVVQTKGGKYDQSKPELW